MILFDVDANILWRKEIEPLEKNKEALFYIGPGGASIQGQGETAKILLHDSRLNENVSYVRYFDLKGNESGQSTIPK